MSEKSLFPLRFILFLLFAIIFLSTNHLFAQTIEPDEQIKLEMIAYARKAKSTLTESRPRIINTALVAGENAGESKEIKDVKFTAEDLNGLSEESSKFSQLEHKAFDLLNEQRISNGLEPLKWSNEIAKIARLHSRNMARDKYFSHKELDGSMVDDRADALGVSDWQSIGENIAFNRGFKLPADTVCEAWMQSPGHRGNILNDKWKETGIGVAIDADGTYYFTQVFILR